MKATKPIKSLPRKSNFSAIGIAKWHTALEVTESCHVEYMSVKPVLQLENDGTLRVKQCGRNIWHVGFSCRVIGRSELS